MKLILCGAIVCLLAGCASAKNPSLYDAMAKISPCSVVRSAMSDNSFKDRLNVSDQGWSGPTRSESNNAIAMYENACRQRPDIEWPQEWRDQAYRDRSNQKVEQLRLADEEANRKRLIALDEAVAERKRAAKIEAIEGPKRRAREALESKKFHEQLIASFRAQRAKGVLYIGISSSQVEKSCWGSPESINRTVNLGGTSEQWVYRSGYLYFTNGKLTSIQTHGSHICVP